MVFENGDNTKSSGQQTTNDWLDSAVLSSNDDYFRSQDYSKVPVQGLTIVDEGKPAGASEKQVSDDSNGNSIGVQLERRMGNNGRPGLDFPGTGYRIGNWITRETVVHQDQAAWDKAESALDKKLDDMADSNKDLTEHEREGLKEVQDAIVNGDTRALSKLLAKGGYSKEELQHIADAFNKNMKELKLDNIAQIAIDQKQDQFGDPEMVMTLRDEKHNTTLEIGKYTEGKGDLMEQKPTKPFDKSPIIGPPGHREKPEPSEYPDQGKHALSVIGESLVSESSGRPMPAHRVERVWMNF